ncbi:MAG: sulfatase [Deltaproteobacteria bacterium]|nr:sulfatase [Deltaproteobacteria bacterium]
MNKRTIVAAAAVVLIVACAAAYRYLAAKQSQYSLVLISLDTLRADRLGAYGYSRPTSPSIDRLAKESALFVNAVSVTSWTLPAHVSLFTGLYPTTHGVRTRELGKIPPSTPLLAEILESRGYKNYGLMGGGYLGADHGFKRGFIKYARVGNPAKFAFGKQVKQAEEILKSIPEHHPYFLFLHTYDIHCPYETPPEYHSHFRSEGAAPIDASKCGKTFYNQQNVTPQQALHLSDHYDASIRMVDDAFGKLIDYLKSRSDYDDTIIIVTSDHGEEFLEHGRIGHILSLNRELLMVPLIIKAPGAKPRAIENTVSLVDITPTVLDLLNIEDLPKMDGRSLGKLLKGENSEIRPFQFSELEVDVNLRSHYDDQYHTIVDLESGSASLFDVTADSTEQNNIAEAQPEVLEERVSQLQKFVSGLISGLGESKSHSDKELEQLRTLGYLD